MVGSDSRTVTVRTKSGQEQQLPGALATFDLVTPEALETNFNNLVDMEAFNEGIILHQVRLNCHVIFVLFLKIKLRDLLKMFKGQTALSEGCNIHICGQHSDSSESLQEIKYI